MLGVGRLVLVSLLFGASQTGHALECALETSDADRIADSDFAFVGMVRSIDNADRDSAAVMARVVEFEVLEVIQPGADGIGETIRLRHAEMPCGTILDIHPGELYRVFAWRNSSGERWFSLVCGHSYLEPDPERLALRNLRLQPQGCGSCHASGASNPASSLVPWLVLLVLCRRRDQTPAR